MTNNKLETKTFGDFIKELNYIEGQLRDMVMKNQDIYESTIYDEISEFLSCIEMIRYDFEDGFSLYPELNLLKIRAMIKKENDYVNNN